MIFHVACLPFPSHQGTQAALAAMLRASTDAGRDTQVLTYAHGAYDLDAPYTVHRIADFPKVRSLRSGPSWGKLLLDGQCILAVRRLARALRPSAIVAHHVEAALAATMAGVGPVYYVAHTSLERELSVYFPEPFAPAMRTLGSLLDRAACGPVAGVAAVAPSLANLVDPNASYLPVPWQPQRRGPERKAARETLALPQDVRICLYAGNLDRYQGWEELMAALLVLKRTEPNARLLVASESDPTPARHEATRLGLARDVDFRRLDSERARALVHSASDVAWIPRRTEGGLPIKMLEAFGRGLPVVATKRATARLPIEGACRIVENENPSELAHATGELWGSDSLSEALRSAGLRYLSTHHSDQAYLTALDTLLGTRATRSQATRPAPHRRAAPELRAR